MMPSILVTGGAGYIGSHIAHALAMSGYHPVILDDLSTGQRRMVPLTMEFIEGCCGDIETVTGILRRYHIDAVIHCAGSIRVDESVSDPLLYYKRNTAISRNLIEACVRAKIKAFVFSSTAAVYGNADRIPITEDAPLAPINPYGRSKLMTEMMLRDAHAAYGLRYAAMRYFNVAGADPESRCGQVIPFVTHLIRRALHVHLGAFEKLDVFGTDYPTPDGTCIRDYIHVSDLAAAHVLCLRYLLAGGESRVLNCGYGRGFSVREVVAAVNQVVKKPISVVEVARREGDPAALVADASWLKKTLGWTPEFDNLNTIITHALAWEKALLEGRLR